MCGADLDGTLPRRRARRASSRRPDNATIHAPQMQQPANFVLCPNYHGATLFGLLANNHDEVTSLGDTLPNRSHMDFFCSCRERIQDCEFWQTVAREMRADRFTRDKKLLPGTPRLLRNYYNNDRLARWIILSTLKRKFSAWNLTPWATRQFREVMEGLPEVSCRAQGTSVFVDGAKELNRAMAYLLIAKPACARVIHIVRDPRGFVVSCDVNLTDKNIASDQWARLWNQYHSYVVNRIVTFPGVEYLRIRYEDLCSNPATTMNEVFHFLGLLSQDVVVAPREPHHLIGNRMLLEFDGTVKLDTRWNEQMPMARQQDILRRTEPLSSQFGYGSDSSTD